MGLFSPKAAADWKAVDMHCHVLPGLDDGSRSIQETLSMLTIAAGEGIDRMVVTPHYNLNHGFTASMEVVRLMTEKVQKAAFAHNIPVTLYPGNEIFYFEGIVDQLNQQRLETMNDSSRVLVEFAPTVLYTTIQNAVEDLIDNDYVPVLAHIERYLCVVRKGERAYELSDMGAEIQTNASTVIGKNGREAKQLIQRLLKDERIDYIGTDAHRSDHRRPEVKECRTFLIKKYGDGYARWIMRDHAMESFLLG
ncbi:MAG TPA: protein-tyrosine-phosphatase [Lachnospiraceae bacterium]|nr:protein-tyrosine-phosphatase [Lachnospiraceae bacterium]